MIITTSIRIAVGCDLPEPIYTESAQITVVWFHVATPGTPSMFWTGRGKWLRKDGSVGERNAASVALQESMIPKDVRTELRDAAAYAAGRVERAL